MRVRGLKSETIYSLSVRWLVAPRAGAWIEILTGFHVTGSAISSHPVRVRGLKYFERLAMLFLTESHPVRVRGLKSISCVWCGPINASHPVRVRGLKFNSKVGIIYTILVAPRAGAWIEIARSCRFFASQFGSHPVRVRGLKYLLTV